MPYLPPDISGSIAHVTAEITIDAPIETVWNIIVDFESYTNWNPFVRSQLITDEQWNPLEPQPKPTEGAFLLMLCKIPPPPDGSLVPVDKSLTTSKEMLNFVEEENHRIGWTQKLYPNWAMKEQRWQELTEVVVDGKTQTKYYTVQVRFSKCCSAFLR